MATSRVRNVAKPTEQRWIAEKDQVPNIGVWITLTRGHAALIDREDQDLAILNWSASTQGRRGGLKRTYAVTESGGYRRYLHQEIFGRIAGDIDHADGDTLNNRRLNLRAASRSLNNANAHKRPGTSSKYKGVHWHNQAQKWTCQVRKQHIGLFVDECDAALAYNLIAFEQYGEFARFNLP